MVVYNNYPYIVRFIIPLSTVITDGQTPPTSASTQPPGGDRMFNNGSFSSWQPSKADLKLLGRSSSNDLLLQSPTKFLKGSELIEGDASSLQGSLPGPSVPGPSVQGPSVPGPSLPGPSDPGLFVPGPSVSGPSVSGPSVSGPSVQGPSVRGPSVFRPSVPGTSFPAPSVPGLSVPGPSVQGLSVPQVVYVRSQSSLNSREHAGRLENLHVNSLSAEELDTNELNVRSLRRTTTRCRSLSELDALEQGEVGTRAAGKRKGPFLPGNENKARRSHH